jgi:hypothetical protein
MGIRSKVGDIFLIEVGNERVVGQIVDKFKSALYVCVFDLKLAPGDPPPQSVAGLEPVFAAITLDALLFHGFWPIVANDKEGIDALCRPRYKIRIDGRTCIETFSGDQVRAASPEEEDQLAFRNISAPIIIDKVVKAYFGEGEWDPQFEKYKYAYAKRTASI